MGHLPLSLFSHKEPSRSGSILSKEENALLQVLLQLEAILCLKVYVTLFFPQNRCLKLEVLTNPSVQGKQGKASWRWFFAVTSKNHVRGDPDYKMAEAHV